MPSAGGILLNKRWTTAGPVRQRMPPAENVEKEEGNEEVMQERYKKVAKYDPTLTKIQFDSSNLEFMAMPSAVEANLTVDRNGGVTIDPDLISNFHSILQIIAVDKDNTCLRNVILQDQNGQEYKDFRLTNPLDP